MNRVQVSPTAPAVSQQRSPPRTHRKSASVSIDATSNFELIMAHASSRPPTNDLSSTSSQRRFSLMSFLNNVTAPMRRTKTATEPGKRRDVKGKTSKLKQPREKGGRTLPAQSGADPQAAGSSLAVAEPHQIQLPSVPCTSFDVCQVTDNLSDVYRPANVSMNPSNDRTLYWSTIDESRPADQEGEGRRECQVCYIHQEEEEFPILRNCDHRPCKRCLIRYLQIEIMESRISLACPECITELHPNDIQAVLKIDPQLILRYERFMIRKVLITEGDVRWCPAPDCDYAVIASGCAACPQLECQRPGCGTLFCYHCKGEWHANQTCDEARGQSVERMFTAATASNSPTEGTNDLFKPGDLKACPRCGTLIVKMNDGSCNHMVCPMCQADFCWLCLKEISDLHYLR
uniref:RBR-type E3 ubiquitin transferase n=1 Tax=Bursaphelenchus xylophilus TaxID=6326 RepID=A0A1I7S693_BURXY